MSMNRIPFDLSVAIALLPDNLSDKEYEKEVRKLIRKRVPSYRASGPIEVYSEEVCSLINDMMLRS